MENKKSNKSVQAVPEGFHTVTPFLMVDNAAGLIEFIKKAFDGKQMFRMDDDNKKIMHATVSIGNSIIMLCDAMDDMPVQNAMLYLYLENVDDVYKKALQAKATSVHEPTNEFYGDRAGAVKDEWGNTWWIATKVEDVELAELERRSKEVLKERKEKHQHVHT
jgi:PhnB protein